MDGWMAVCELLVTKNHQDSGLSSYFNQDTISIGSLLLFFVVCLFAFVSRS